MRTIIKNGTIITAYNEYKADILIEDEKIIAISENIKEEADKIIDASGKYVFPGGVDQHTHFSALCNVGDRDTAGYETTKAVVVGGTTTIIDYAPQDPGKGLIDSAKYRINVRAKDKTCVDFALHALITEVTDDLFDEIKELPKYGISSIKAFMAYKGSPLHVDDGTLYKVLLKSKEVGVTVFVHAENAEIIDTLQKECLKNNQTSPKYHAVSRPPFVEGEATRRAIYIAESVGAPLFVVHITCEEAVDAVAEARARKSKVYGETCTQYLITTKEKLADPDFNESAKYVCSPALRDEKHQAVLWESLNNGILSAIVSDHCGIDLKELKQVGRDDFTKIPNGAPGAADRINMIWTNGVAKNIISKQKFVEVCSTLPAKFNGIYPRKGHIDIGSDADIVVFDPEYRGVVRLEDNPNGIDYNIYEGREQIGRPETVLLRGKVVVEDGKFVGELGQGKYIESETYAAAYTESI